MNSSSIVLKFGGASLATPEHFCKVAKIIGARKKEFGQVAVVVSAMGKMTDELVDLAYQVHPNPPKREYDMLVSAGERMSIALLAMALDKEGYQAVSFTGSQSGIITTSNHTQAHILDVRPFRILQAFDEGQVVIIAGFQGVSENKEITTLGRGGSDTSAVALALALKACRVEFFKDVKGIYSDDPKHCEKAVFYSSIDYAGALAIAKVGSGVIHPRAIELAEKNSLPLRLLSFAGKSFGLDQGTWIGKKDQQVLLPPVYEKNSLRVSAC